MGYANQLQVTVHKAEITKEKKFAAIDMQALQKAMQTLKGESFKMWVYMAKNKNLYTFDLSPTAIADWGIKKDAYYAAKEKLINEGYLKQTVPNGRHYTFYEDAQPQMAQSWFGEDL